MIEALCDDALKQASSLGRVAKRARKDGSRFADYWADLSEMWWAVYDIFSGIPERSS